LYHRQINPLEWIDLRYSGKFNTVNPECTISQVYNGLYHRQINPLEWIDLRYSNV